MIGVIVHWVYVWGPILIGATLACGVYGILLERRAERLRNMDGGGI